MLLYNKMVNFDLIFSLPLLQMGGGQQALGILEIPENPGYSLPMDNTQQNPEIATQLLQVSSEADFFVQIFGLAVLLRFRFLQSSR